MDRTIRGLVKVVEDLQENFNDYVRQKRSRTRGSRKKRSDIGTVSQYFSQKPPNPFETYSQEMNQLLFQSLNLVEI